MAVLVVAAFVLDAAEGVEVGRRQNPFLFAVDLASPTTTVAKQVEPVENVAVGAVKDTEKGSKPPHSMMYRRRAPTVLHVVVVIAAPVAAIVAGVVDDAAATAIIAFVAAAAAAAVGVVVACVSSD